VLPSNEHTLKAAYLQDIVYLIEKTQQYPQIKAEYAINRSLPLFSGRGPGAYNDEEWQMTLGFVVDDVDQTIYAGVIPPRRYEAMRGRFRRDDIDHAARTGPMNDVLEVVSYGGHEFYSWGGDNEVNLAMRSSVRPLGRGHRLAIVDDFIFWMLWTDGIKEMIDSYEDNIESLADNEDYRLLAAALEELDTVTAFFSSESHSESHFKEVHPDIEQVEPETKERLLRGLESGAKLKPYLALTTGAGIDEKGHYLVIVLANADERTARENVKRLEQRINQAETVWGNAGGRRWSDIVESMEIESRGRLTMAKLYGEVCIYWTSFSVMGVMGMYEPLLMHE